MVAFRTWNLVGPPSDGVALVPGQSGVLVDEYEFIGTEQDLSQLFPGIKPVNDRSGKVQFRMPSAFFASGSDFLNHGCPKVLIVIEPISDVDNEVDGISAFDIKCCYIELLIVVVQADAVVEPTVRTDHKGADAIARFGFVPEVALDGDSHVLISCPASNRGMLAVIARVAAGGC